MKLEEVKQSIAALANSGTDNFVVHGVDLLNIVVDNARKWAERKHDFHATMHRVELQPTYGVHFAIPHNVKKIVAAQILTSTNSPGYTTLNGPIPVISVADANRRMKYFAPIPPQTGYNFQWNQLRRLALVIVNPYECYLFPEGGDSNPKVNLFIDAFHWNPTYIGQGSNYEDWFLQHGYDFMIYRGLMELSSMDAQADVQETGLARVRYNVSYYEKRMMEAFESMVSLDVSMTEGAYDVSLD